MQLSAHMRAQSRTRGRVSKKPHVGVNRAYGKGHRYYSPTLARWLSRDPIGEAQGKSLYSMVSGNPVGSVDLFGLVSASDAWECGCCCAEKIEVTKDEKIDRDIAKGKDKGHAYGNIIHFSITLSYAVSSGSGGGFKDCKITVREKFSRDSNLTSMLPVPKRGGYVPVPPGADVNVTEIVESLPFWQQRSRLIFGRETVVYKDHPILVAGTKVHGPDGGVVDTTKGVWQRDLTITVTVESGKGCEYLGWCGTVTKVYRQRLRMKDGILVDWPERAE